MDNSGKHPAVLTRRSVLGLTAALLAFPNDTTVTAESGVLVHKDPNCGCCSGWVRHLKEAGFTVTIKETADIRAVRKRLRVPANLAACHTAEADGYVIEGHVPAVAVRRLLKERPNAVGLAVPGMPLGSPGMEGRRVDSYDVILFDASSRRTYMQFIGGDIAG